MPQALLTLGFRPFFILAGATAVLSMGVWLYAGTHEFALQTYYGPVAWHSHELLFGYAVAVIAGFLLTAVRNWTHIDTTTGPSLVALVLLWLAGRLLPLFPRLVPDILVAVADVAFLPALAWRLAIPLVKSGQRRNLIVILVLALMALANVTVHLQPLGITHDTARVGIRFALNLIILLILIIGGRVIPFFTERAVADFSPRRHTVVEVLSIGSVVLLIIVQLVYPVSPVIAVVAGTAAGLHTLRWLGWYSPRVWSLPLLWVLHVGYAWIVVGLLLTALGHLEWVAPSVAIHALTVGGIGVLTLGMMARVSLGHTGRALTVNRPVAWSFILLNVAALVRVLLPIVLPSGYPLWIPAAGLIWCVAFMIFVVTYAPMLWSARVDDQVEP